MRAVGPRPSGLRGPLGPWGPYSPGPGGPYSPVPYGSNPYVPNPRCGSPWKTIPGTPRRRAHGASRSARSPSTSRMPGSQSSRAYAHSAAVHQAFSGTATSPASCAAQNATCHSGLFRPAITARSPGRRPYAPDSRRARPAAAAWKAA